MACSMRTTVATLLLSFQVFWLALPLTPAYAGGSIDLNLPIGELQGLIQQLQDSANQVVGEAGIEIRQTVQELADQVNTAIDNARNAAKDVIREAAEQLRMLINQVVQQLRALLTQVQDIIQKGLRCIDAVIAARIAQIKDSLASLLKQVDNTLRQAIDRLYVRADQIVISGSSNILTVANGTLITAAKVAILIIVLIVLFWIIRTLWQGAFPKQSAIRIGVPIFLVAFLAGCGYLLISKSALAHVFGSDVVIPRAEDSCTRGQAFYSRFFALRNANAPAESLKVAGDAALEALAMCSYVSFSGGVIQGLTNQMDEVTAVLYPPPPPPTPSGTPGECESVNPGWYSKFDLSKIRVLSTLRIKAVLAPSAALPVHDPNVYFRAVQLRTNVDAKAAATEAFKPQIFVPKGRQEIMMKAIRARPTPG